MKQTTVITDFTSGNISKQLVSFATPLFLSNLLQAVYNMVDLIIVGHFIGGVGLSAVSIGGDLLNFLTFIAIGFSNAGQIIISQSIGAKQYSKISGLIGTLFSFLLTCSLFVTIVCLISTEALLNIMNTPDEARNLANSYLVTCLTGLMFIFGYNIVSAILRGMGDSKRPFKFIAVAAILNIILDFIFIAGFGWGTFGAALATVLSQGVSFLWALSYLYRKRAEIGFDFKFKSFVIQPAILTHLIKLGFPMSLKSASIQSSKLFVNSWINSYGVAISAVSAIGTKLGMISNLFANAINAAGSSMIGQNYGAKKYERIPQIIGISFVLSAVISFLLIIAISWFPIEIFGIFTSDSTILKVAIEYVPIAILTFASSAFRAPMSAFIDGTGNYKLNFLVAILDAIVTRVGLAILLGLVLDLGYLGFWYGGAIASFVPFLIGGTYYLTGKWKKEQEKDNATVSLKAAK